VLLILLEFVGLQGLPVPLFLLLLLVIPLLDQAINSGVDARFFSLKAGRGCIDLSLGFLELLLFIH